jgi:protein-tyrosine phosphatase
MSSPDPTIIRVGPRHAGHHAVERAAAALRRGALVILPTDTVYGVAADPAAAGALDRLYAAKGRDPGKPVPFLVADAAEVTRAGAVMGWRARRLARRYWPGPLTLVLPLGGGFEGFRVPDHPVTLAVLRAAGGVLRVTSANLSGQPAACDAAAAAAALAGHVELVIDAGPAPLGRESTVVREEGDTLRILRQGALPAAAVQSRPRVVMVCTGNVCRSPMAEYLLRRWLGPDSAWEVQSAGVAAADDMPASQAAVMALAELGIDAAGHRSRSLDEGLIDAADLIVVMTSDHRRHVLHRFPRARGRVFLLKSFGHAGRDQDIADPIGLPLEAYREVRDEMNAVLPDLALHLHECLLK